LPTGRCEEILSAGSVGAPPVAADGPDDRRDRRPLRLGGLHYDHDYDVIAQHTDLEFDSVWLAPCGSL